MYGSTTTDPGQVWVGCLACYNAGHLVGEWVDADEAADFVPCRRPTHEEWWCFDIEGPVARIVRGECSPMQATAVAEAIKAAERRGVPAAAFAAYCSNYGYTDPGPDAVVEAAESYRGEWASERDFAESWADDVMDIPESMAVYFDWPAFTRDLFMGDFWSAEAPGGGVFVFDANA